MSGLQILIPGLFGPMPGFQSPQPPKVLKWLLGLLGRAQVVPLPGRSFEQVLFALCGGEGTLRAEAALRRLGDGATADDACWIQVNPVLLKPDQDRLLLFDAEEFELSLDDARQIAERVSEHFVDLEWSIEVPLAHRWYLKLKTDPHIQSYPLGDVFGRNLFHFLPRGAEARQWRSLINETQMLLHGLELNQRREQTGRAPVNGLWFSGEGRLADLSWNNLRPDQLYGDDAFVRGLSNYRNIPCSELPRSGESIPEGGRMVLLWSELERPVWRADPEDWWQAVERFAIWLNSLLTQQAGRFGTVELLPCNGQAYRITQGQRWKLWRRTPSFDTLLDSNVHPD